MYSVKKEIEHKDHLMKVKWSLFYITLFFFRNSIDWFTH